MIHNLSRLIAVLLLLSAGFATAQELADHPLVWEFLPDPTGALQSEWVELYNPGDTTVDLGNYCLGDELGWRHISDSALLLPAGAFIILAQDAANFAAYYGEVPCPVSEPVGWQILNNGGDAVWLGTGAGTTLDSCCYVSGQGDNRSWERYLDDAGISFWGGAYDRSGSTPGHANSYYPNRAQAITLTVSPDPFSPDGDGFEDATVISYVMPEAASFDLRVYDVAGFEVRTFIEAGPAIPGEIVWDGRGEDGRRLPTGMYILFARCLGQTTSETKRIVAIIR